MPGRIRTLTAVVAASACLAVPALLAAPSQAHPRPVQDPAVITTWNGIAAETIYLPRGVPPVPGPIPTSALYFAFVHLAVYDAVVAIEGRYEPYLGRVADRDEDRGHRHASSAAAAATAARDVLRHWFPDRTEALDAAYATTLAGLGTVGVERGKKVGAGAAARLVRDRQGDGVPGSATFAAAPAPGVWRPTPPSHAPFFAPWLGFVRPLLLESPTQFDPPGPDPLSSGAYARDFREVKAKGALEGSTRTAAETATGLFWNANAVLQQQVAMRGQVDRRDLDIVETARAFAILGSTTADAIIAGWRAKFDDGYWRPSTAIGEAATDGNPATEPDPTWRTLAPANPPYPDYVSGHAVNTGAASGTLAHLFGARSIAHEVPSLSPPGSPVVPARRFATTLQMDRETMDARIWLGLHFRKAMTDGNALGHDVARWGVTHFFRPIGDRDG